MRCAGWLRAVAGVAVLMGAVGGCTPAEVVPVPTSASEPFVCDGVPARAIELVLDIPRADFDVRQSGAWDGAVFTCEVAAGPGEAAPAVSVTLLPWAGGPYGSLAAATRAFALVEAPGRPLEVVGGSGSGMAQPIGEESAQAVWACADVYLEAELRRVAEPGRDAIDDAANLVVSMLPWACGDQEVPRASR